MTLDRKLTDLKGIGEKTEKLFQKIGVYTVGDILLNFPRTYVKYPDIKDPEDFFHGELTAVYGRIKTPILNKKTRSMDISIGTLYAGNTGIELIWFRSPYVRSQVHVEQDYVFYGKLLYEGGKWKLEQPKIYTYDGYVDLQRRLQPCYSLTKGLSNHLVTKTISQALCFSHSIPEYLDAEEMEQLGVCSESESIEGMHFPETMEVLERARNRQVFDEFFRFFYQMKANRSLQEEVKNEFCFEKTEVFHRTLENLPFSLTNGQNQVLKELLQDFDGDVISERMIQGDVGSGKTMLAFLAMLYHVENGYETAIMAPTEVLARQHYETFLAYKERFHLPYEVVCLTGSTKASERREIQEILNRGEGAFIIGTQALIQEKVEFKHLSLVITDEQHRFGVKQRKTISDKGENPFILVMSATPIPRSLAMILYGDMKVSVMTDLPAMRLPIKNAVMKKKERQKIWGFLRSQVKEGHQAYVICPLVEASENSEGESAVEYQKMLEESFGNEVKVGLLHGKMKPKEKNAMMESFAKGDVDVLVSTTVVEVGVNVPNATVMVIEDAHRFGLAQLHQLRGRVGRGDAQSYCIFVDGSNAKEMSKRLKVMGSSNDGFYVANEDLKLRGPGDFLGIRQSGEMNFHLADIYQDADMMKIASSFADRVLMEDAELVEGNHCYLKEYLELYASKVYTNL